MPSMGRKRLKVKVEPLPAAYLRDRGSRWRNRRSGIVDREAAEGLASKWDGANEPTFAPYIPQPDKSQKACGHKYISLRVGSTG